MRCLPVAPLAAAALIGTTPAHAADARDAVVAADTLLTGLAARNGVRDGYLDMLASSGLLLRPAPVNGPSLLQGDEPDRNPLRRAPERVIVARSADLAVSVGPYAGRPAAGADGLGHYVAVWRTGDDGDWKLQVDAAMPHGDGPGAVDAVAGLPLLPWVAPAGLCDANALGAAERQVVDARAGGNAPAARLYAADAVVLRSDLAPVAAGAAPRGRVWRDAQMRGTWVAQSQDLAVMTGLVRTDAAERGYGFLHAWTCEGGGWKLKLDLENLPR
ncbi:nuclear transport factor 2 family protein [Derxia lacustris]|uniref:nuclear transport factor 2 family protein n=1 Tax=Derxia lacustris TaxID=764842 RepID=UPI000A173AE2|nr:nuclear transport factor 2 family protein [Derxia lacustris]